MSETDPYAVAGSIRRALYDIRDHYDNALEPPRVKMSEGSSGTKEAPTPVPLNVLDVRRETHADLLHYARVIQFEVTDMQGGRISERLDGDDPIELAYFIDRWAERLADVTSEGGRCAADLGHHARKLRNLAMGLGARRFTIGTCPEHGTSEMGERVPCVGNLRAVLRKDDDLLPSCVECDVDREHSWSASEWMQLGRRIHGLTAAS